MTYSTTMINALDCILQKGRYPTGTQQQTKRAANRHELVVLNLDGSYSLTDKGRRAIGEPPAPATTRPGDMAAAYAEETGVDYSTALVHCNMD